MEDMVMQTRQAIKDLVQQGKDQGWRFILEKYDPGGNFERYCGFFHGDEFADVVDFNGEFLIEHIEKAFEIAVSEVYGDDGE